MKPDNKYDKFIYDETSPTCLRHRYSRFLNGGEVVKANTMAGHLRYYKDGKPRNSCVCISKDGKTKQEYLHRVVFILHNGEIPEGFVVDHIDGNPHNNKISNLRAVPQKINARNVSKRRTNTSGITGVNLVTNKAGVQRWRAFWYEKGKFKSKSFSCKCLGYEVALNSAIVYREMQIKRLNTLGDNYSERHGQ